MLFFGFGLYIKSDIRLSRLISIEEQLADIEIYQCESAYNSELGFEQERFWKGSKQSFSVYVPDVAYFKIVDGKRILYFPDGQHDIDSIALFILGTCMGALLAQRKKLVLHANAIKINGKAILFCGPSGIGKSTLAAKFVQKGYSILADDLSVIDEKNQVSPSYPYIKLWHETSENLNIPTQQLNKVRPQIEKYALPLDDHFYRETLPVESIIQLKIHNKKTFKIEELNGFKKIPLLYNNTYRIKHVEEMGLLDVNMALSANLANHTRIYEITRPDSGFMINELVEYILNHV
ncbi:hypothetical protein [Marinomonas mediterranea]|uniref:hypothetical protein n=1 Tax=Marinomonas mediterranea TaxID=119864 RepID=UPI00234918D3|nr:hypothetical protein [Marinomonas mediterranea]WCN08579.1 hypothetical protein GV055_06370 [Marinomonas mediterranea]WCN12633.1 hypothetical protein GV054_06210 [Marinomonas mediterranea]